MIPYKFKSSHWLKSQHSDWRENLVKDFFLQINFLPMRALESKLPYDFSYHMKKPQVSILAHERTYASLNPRLNKQSEITHKEPP